MQPIKDNKKVHVHVPNISILLHLLYMYNLHVPAFYQEYILYMCIAGLFHWAKISTNCGKNCIPDFIIAIHAYSADFSMNKWPSA